MAFGKSVFVTGANRGIGLELVTQLAKHQSRPQYIFAACRSPDGAEDDISNAQAIVSKHVKDEGLNVLINNAGCLQLERSIEEVTPETMFDHYRVNAVAPAMIIKASKNGSSKPMGCSRAAILNMSTKVASFSDNTSGGVYSYRCSKVALNMATKNLSIELQNDQILAVNFHPGWVQTNIGSKHAPATTYDCVRGLMKVAEGLNEKDNGLFYDFEGTLIPW